MKRFNRTLIATACLSLFAGAGFAQTPNPSAEPQAHTAFDAQAMPSLTLLRKATPFQENNGFYPLPGQYKGPFFKLNHAWPTKPLPPLTVAPWRQAIGNRPITIQNAPAYARALKDAVTPNARKLILDYANWDAAKAGWYNEPWLGSLRESIHGTYPAGQFGPSIFPGTGLRAVFQTHVLTYYDARAAWTIQNFWGTSAMTPTLKTQNSQFDEGAIIVKAAVFASTDPAMQRNWWDAMKGAQEWPLEIPVNSTYKNGSPQFWSGYVAQFDIIVKDSQSSPQTGWVFMTLVYDPNAPGKDAWDKMVPLGVQWGNDPQATSPSMPLRENWNNPAAPKYSTQTLGWGGRLSGPNDGARNDIVYNGKAYKNEPDSSCMSCHSTAQWNIAQHRMTSFLLPSYTTNTGPGFKTCNAQGKEDPSGSYICSPAPGTPEWMKWFQNRKGNVAMDPGSFATDFDEVFSFKALKLWYTATNTSGEAAPQLQLLSHPGDGVQYNQYTGAPLPKDGE